MPQRRDCVWGTIILLAIITWALYLAPTFWLRHVSETRAPGTVCRQKPGMDINWTAPTIPDHLLDADQDDPDLIKYVCENWIIEPSRQPRQLNKPNEIHYSQSRQSIRVNSILADRTNGFYVECGAAAGERLSNSLYFEKHRNWSGVLIEGYNPWFKKLLKLHRRAYSVGACLSGVKKPVRTQFVNIGYGGGLIDYMAKSHLDRFGGANRMVNESETMYCLPLYSILRAMGVSHVDYFSLDIEGAELEVIKTLPLDEITVDVFTIEYVVGLGGGTTDSRVKLQEIRDYLVGQHGYEVFHVNPGDDVFLKRKGI